MVRSQQKGTFKLLLQIAVNAITSGLTVVKGAILHFIHPITPQVQN